MKNACERGRAKDVSRTGVAGGAIVVMFRKGFRANARAARRSQAQLRLHGVDKRRIHGSTSGRVGGAAFSGAIGACGTSTSPGQPADVLFFRNDDPPPDKSASGCSPRAAAHGMNLQPLVVGPRGEAWAGLEVAESAGGRRLLSLLRPRCGPVFSDEGYVSYAGTPVSLRFPESW